MSVRPSLAAQARQQRTAPPSVPPHLERSEFDSDEAYAVYVKDRRKAKERLREFNRPPRLRRGASEALKAAIEVLRTRERRIMFGCNVETGRKQAPSAEWTAHVAALERRPAPERYKEKADQLPKLTSAEAMLAALQQQPEHANISLSQVRRAVTAVNQREKAMWPDSITESRQYRRSIKKGLSATRPAAYPAQLQRKREAEREARRPQLEARRLERAQMSAQRAKAVAIAKWAYDTCLEEEHRAREYDADDLWYLRERRLDAGSALRIARGSSETPRWELPVRKPKRGPVYRSAKQWARLRAAAGDSDDSDAQVAELARDYGPTSPPLPPPLPPPQLPRPQQVPMPTLPPPPPPRPPRVASPSQQHHRCKGVGCYVCGYSGRATAVKMLCEGCRSRDPSWRCSNGFGGWASCGCE